MRAHSPTTSATLEVLRQDARPFKICSSQLGHTTDRRHPLRPLTRRADDDIDTHIATAVQRRRAFRFREAHWALEVRQTSITSSLRVFDCIIACRVERSESAARKRYTPACRERECACYRHTASPVVDCAGVLNSACDFAHARRHESDFPSPIPIPHLRLTRLCACKTLLLSVVATHRTQRNRTGR